MTKKEQQQEALQNAVGHESLTNYPAIFEGFEAKGLKTEEIEPRVNVFTYKAWQALGRQVQKGQKGVKVVTWVPMEKKDKKTGDVEKFSRPRTTTVFHITQTEKVA
jgi:antirestriction protein ArdC